MLRLARHWRSGVPALLLALSLSLPAADFRESPPSSAWSRGLPTDENYFPIGVWLQNPRNAGRYREAGINLYIGLWKGPTESQLNELEAAGMPVICAQTEYALSQLDRLIIVGWMHDDEPDNAQSLGEGRGYGPPIEPARIVADYHRLRERDPSRPVLLNLGQGVAWDDYIGRGVRRNHPEDYPEYVQGCDIASFDIYPVVHRSPEVAGRLEFVARGVERLARWAGPDRIVWNCIECTHIGNPDAKATPEQVRAEVWMSLIHGSRGLIYFVHQFQPSFREAALLEDPGMLAAITAINREIRELAPVLNSPTVSGAVRVQTPAADKAIAVLMKERNQRRYLFAVNLRHRATEGTFELTDVPASGRVRRLDGEGGLTLREGRFTDAFAPYAVRLYAIDPRP